jgi:hypothetical protein
MTNSKVVGMNRKVTGVNEDFRIFRAAEMVNDSGTLIRPLPARIFSGQDVLEVSGCHLVWRQTDYPFVISMAYKDLSGAEDILLQFAKLHNGDPQAIFTFARKWGVLGICKHGLPASHNPYLLAQIRSDPFCEPFKLGSRYAEPLVYWQHYSAQARSLLRIAARLHLGKSGLKKDWDRVFELEPLDCKPDYGTDVNEDKLMLTLIVNRWIEFGNVRPRFKWWNDEIRVSYDCTLFGILASQLRVFRTFGAGCL